MGFWQILTILEKIHKNAQKSLTSEGSGCAKMAPLGVARRSSLRRFRENLEKLERIRKNLEEFGKYLEEFWLQVLQVFKGSALRLRLRTGRSCLTQLGQRFWRP